MILIRMGFAGLILSRRHQRAVKGFIKKLTLLDLCFRTITLAFRPEGDEIGNKETNWKFITYSSGKKYWTKTWPVFSLSCLFVRNKGKSKIWESRTLFSMWVKKEEEAKKKRVKEQHKVSLWWRNCSVSCLMWYRNLHIIALCTTKYTQVDWSKTGEIWIRLWSVVTIAVNWDEAKPVFQTCVLSYDLGTVPDTSCLVELYSHYIQYLEMWNIVLF